MADQIHFSANPGKDLAEFLLEKNYSKIAVLVDENTKQHCYPQLSENLPTHQIIEVKSGEENKTLETCSIIWAALTDQALDRHSVVIVLGGGVLGDMGGFCAATYKRGIDFVLISTTLLSQVDSSIGGKLGIDFQQFKNHIGVFQHPALTILHAGFLKTLPTRELRSGFAEILKHALISDKPVWQIIIKKNLAEQDWTALIKHSVEFKSEIVRQDPKENGVRKILNAGHTIGHAIESHLLNANRKVLHGEAIAAGLIAESFIAHQRRLLSEPELKEICGYVLTIFGKIDLRVSEFESISELTLQDKKNKGSRVLCVLLNGIGNAKWDCEINSEEVKQALAFYHALH